MGRLTLVRLALAGVIAALAVLLPLACAGSASAATTHGQVAAVAGVPSDDPTGTLSPDGSTTTSSTDGSSGTSSTDGSTGTSSTGTGGTTPGGVPSPRPGRPAPRARPAPVTPATSRCSSTT